MRNLFSFDETPDNMVYVLDTETTGLLGAPEDVVVDIGICLVDLDHEIVKEVYSAVIGHDVDAWNDYRRNAWIFQNTDMTLDDVKDGRPFPDVLNDVRSILLKKNVTAYNTGYDFNKFLFREPWNLRGTFNQYQDIMLAATYVCKLKSMNYFDDYRWPKLDNAYKMILKDEDPAGINGKQNHRALSDAKMASYIMIEMHRNGNYPYDKGQCFSSS